MPGNKEVVPITADNIAAVDALGELDNDLRAHLAQRCHGLRVKRGAEILSYQDETRDVYFIISGSVRANNHAATGRLITYQLLKKGEMFGELSALDGLPRLNSVVAEEDCLLARVPWPFFRELMRENGAFAHAITLRLVQLARWLGAKIFEYHAYDVKGRVYAEMLRLADEDGQPTGKENEVLLPKAPTDGDIASRVGTTRENVNRIIGAMKTSKVISREPEGLLICDVDTLRKWLVDSETR